jgi:probable F420-dependent oxidoreductase
MRFGIALRTMGTAATGGILQACAARAESAGLDTLWIPDHIAIPPDDAEGSGGRYLDPLATLAWLAARTSRIRLGTAVLILPYRPALPTAKAIATIQELSGERLELGVGVGWMEAEFRAVGRSRGERGRLCDEVLGFLHGAFDAPDDVAVSNGQPFLFRPNPKKPRIWIGGAAPQALVRAARFGDGWLPMNDDPEKLVAPIAELAARFAAAGTAAAGGRRLWRPRPAGRRRGARSAGAARGDRRDRVHPGGTLRGHGRIRTGPRAARRPARRPSRPIRPLGRGSTRAALASRPGSRATAQSGAGTKSGRPADAGMNASRRAR